MWERLKICWYALTKKGYAVFFFDKKKPGNSGAKCFINEKAEMCSEFIQSCEDYLMKVDLINNNISVIRNKADIEVIVAMANFMKGKGWINESEMDEVILKAIKDTTSYRYKK